MISMHVNASSFVAGVTKFNKTSISRIQRTFQRAVSELFRRVVERTPVDTGRLRAGWRIGSSAADYSELGPATTPTGRGRRVATLVRSGSRAGSRRYVSAGMGTFDKSGRTTLASGRASVQGLSLEGPVYIYNNVRYAYYVEHGLPPGRKPRRMLGRAIAEWPAIVAQAKAGL